MIRRFEQADAEDYYSMAREFYSSGASSRSISDDSLYTTFALITSNSPYVQGYIFEYEGEPVGYALITLTYSAEVGGLVILTNEAYVLPEYRGMGFCSEFIRYLEDMFAEKAKLLRLELEYTNLHAIELYQNMGFQAHRSMQMIKQLG